MLRKLVLVAVLLAAAIIGYRWYDARHQAQLASALATNSAAVLSVSFKQAKALKVYEARGVLIANSTDRNALGIPATQTTKAPFTVDYFVDLSRIDQNSYRWDARSRTMFVELPDVTVAAPNVDESRAQVEQGGLWISRDAGTRMQRSGSTALGSAATEAARKPERIEAARRSAVEAVSAMTTAPLAAAGLTNVRVVARFPFDRTRDERWDVSRPLSEVIAERM